MSGALPEAPTYEAKQVAGAPGDPGDVLGRSLGRVEQPLHRRARHVEAAIDRREELVLKLDPRIRLRLPIAAGRGHGGSAAPEQHRDDDADPHRCGERVVVGVPDQARRAPDLADGPGEEPLDRRVDTRIEALPELRVGPGVVEPLGELLEDLERKVQDVVVDGALTQESLQYAHGMSRRCRCRDHVLPPYSALSNMHVVYRV